MNNIVSINVASDDKKAKRRRQVREAQQRFKAEMRAEGFKQSAFWLNPDSQKLLEDYCKKTGATRDEAVNDLIDLAQAEIKRLSPKSLS